MNKFIMYMGLPGSGKSTLALKQKAYYEQLGYKVVYLSSDNIRKELYGSEEVQREPYKVFELMLHRALAALNREYTIVLYDATNLSSKRRTNLLKQLRQGNPNLECVVKVVLVPLETCVYRNFKRERVVPFSAIMKMFKSFQCPHRFEGWNKIELVYTDWPNAIDKEDLVEMALKFDQSCPSHRENLYEHITRTIDYLNSDYFFSIIEADELMLLEWALFYHDFGKLYTQTDRNKKGEKTYFKRDGKYLPNMHYYGHDCASAYLWLTSSSVIYFLKEESMNQEEVIEIANMIQYHMEKLKRDERGYIKLAERLPQSLVRRIEIMNACDKNGRIVVDE